MYKRNTKTKHLNIQLLVLLSISTISVSCFSQISSKGKILKTDLMEQNLKGPVKSFNLTVKYINPSDRDNSANRIATPSGDNENTFVEFNKLGLMTSSLLGVYNDNLELQPLNDKYLKTYTYDEIDLDLAEKTEVTNNLYPSIFSPAFYLLTPNTTSYFNHELTDKYVYKMTYDKNKKFSSLNIYRKFYSRHKDDGKEITIEDNIQSKWRYKFNANGLLDKINIQKDIRANPVFVKYFRKQLEVYNSEITFEYDKQKRLIKYIIYSLDNNSREQIAFIKYDYNPVNEFIETETIYKKYPEQYYLSNVHYNIRKYNNQGDLIANLLQVEPKDKSLVRDTQVYLDKYYDYTYDQNNNWIECRIRVRSSENEISAVMNRKIEYYKN